MRAAPLNSRHRRSATILGSAALLASMLMLSDCNREGTPNARETHMLSFGYLSGKTLPNSMALLPPPPADGSDAMRRDEEERLAAIASAGGARTALAAGDSVLAFPQAAESFSCALGVAIDKQRTPRVYNMMAKMLIDVRAASYPAKSRYGRVRPFVAHQTRSCAPAYAETIRTDGSYPSGQSATGWAYALALSDVSPVRRGMLMMRAREFGQSRLICDVQWRSDVDAGKTVGEAIYTQLRNVPEFRADLTAAKAEVANASPAANCAQEEMALKDVRVDRGKASGR